MQAVPTSPTIRTDAAYFPYDVVSSTKQLSHSIIIKPSDSWGGVGCDRPECGLVL